MSALPEWAWIPIVFAAAAAQTLRNTAQRSLTETAGVLPATFVRFAFGLPFAALALYAALAVTGKPMPAANWAYAAWLSAGAVAQLAATAFLLGAMSRRSYVVAVVYSKTEIVQIGIFTIALLREPLAWPSVAAIAIATAGVVLLSAPAAAKSGAGMGAWLSPGAWLGLGSGAGFALASVSYRGAMLELGAADAWVAGIYSVTWAQVLQAALLGAYLVLRDRAGLAKTMAEWRVSTFAGATGAVASIGWMIAYGLRSAADVRIVGLVEVVYGYVVSRRVFREAVSRAELTGIVLVVAGIALVAGAS